MKIRFPAIVPSIALSLAFPLTCRPQLPPPGGDLEGGWLAYQQSDYATALRQLTPLAKAGNSAAQVLLGTMNLKGQGVSKDPPQAFKWYQAAAGQGNAEGEFFVGSMYLMGAGIAHDTAQGMRWLGLAADHGSPDAQVLLGLVYLQGHDGVARDLVRADVWFQLAAAGGDPLAPKQIVSVEKQMTPDQIAKAKSAAAAWKPQAVSRKVRDKKN